MSKLLAAPALVRAFNAFTTDQRFFPGQGGFASYFTQDAAPQMGHNGGPPMMGNFAPVNPFREITADQATMDAAGAFLIGELERLDQTLHMPLISVTWDRDIDLREDVSLGDEFSSFTNSNFAAPGGMSPNGKAWTSSNANAIPGPALDIGKTMQLLHEWAMEVKWSLFELESARRLGRPIDSQKTDVLKTKHNMDIDEMVYLGDDVKGVKGMFNHGDVTPTNVPNGASTSPLWANKTPEEILKDVNEILTTTWNNSAWTAAPDQLRLPPSSFGYISGTRVSANSDTTILEFVREKNISTVVNGKPLNIQAVKWLETAGVGGFKRMTAYTRKPEFVRYPMVPLQRTPLEWRQLHQITTYYCRLGQVELVYPETMSYRDRI